MHPFGEVFADAPHAYVAITTRSGPHVSPQLHAVWGDRLWLLVARDALKARVLRRRPATSVLAVGGDGRAAVVRGEARILDPASPLESLDALPEAVLAAPAVGGYVRRNARELAALVAAQLGGRLGGVVPTRRVVVAVRPDAHAILDPTGVTCESGRWPARARVPDGAPDPSPPLDVDALPPEAGALLREPRACVVGWETAGAPLALPARWDPDRRVALVRPEHLALAPEPGAARACITFDGADGSEPDAKHGVMLRGAGRAGGAGGAAHVAVDVGALTWWRGARTQTVPARRVVARRGPLVRSRP